MKKQLSFVFLAVLLGGLCLPHSARAESSFSFSFSDGGFYGPDHGMGPYRGWHHHPYYYGPPIVVEPPPPVVYAPAPAVVYAAPVVQYIPESTLAAEATSPVFLNGNGQQCREYQTTAIVNGRASPIHGTACLQPDGAWRVVQ